MTEQTLDRGDPETLFRFQVGEPVEHRGIVVAPLFPLRDPVAAYVTLDEALARGFASPRSSEGARARTRRRRTRSTSACCSTTARSSSARSRTASSTSACSSARARSSRFPSRASSRAGGLRLAAFAAAGHVSNAELRRAQGRGARGRGRSPAASAQGEVWDAVHEKPERMEVDSPTGGEQRHLRRPRRARSAGLETRSRSRRASAAPSSRLGDALCLDCVSRPDAFARAVAEAARRLPARRARAAGRARDAGPSGSRVRRQVGQAPAHAQPSAGPRRGHPPARRRA